MKVSLTQEGTEMLLRLEEDGDADEVMLRQMLPSPCRISVGHEKGRVKFVLLEISKQPDADRPEPTT